MSAINFNIYLIIIIMVNIQQGMYHQFCIDTIQIQNHYNFFLWAKKVSVPNIKKRGSKGDNSCLLDLAKKYCDTCNRKKG